ncbi:flagellin [Caulobacter sp. SLTY]|uniref:flagellin n=1 Tax=Caulobacter sp. SLTY TaxID=2683262 RepID=UPI0014120996|nr:flagellin [Caulobacter sp. SLTY]NBB16975.1 flagellin [Caulobacter sp. SLTY]
MTRVATANNYSIVLSDLMRAQSRQAEANQQVSSGKSADDLKGFSRHAETLMAARSVQTRVEGFLEQGKVLTARLEAQDLALNQAADSAQGARQAIAEALAAGRADALAGELSSWFGSATEALNTRHGGRYLFSGGQIDTKPVTAEGLADLTAAPAIADLFTNDGLKPVSRLDESTTIESGFLADELGSDLFEAFRQVQAYIETNGAFSSPMTDAQASFLEGMLDDFDAARVGLTEQTARNGLNQNRLDASLERQEARSAMLQGVVADVTEVDMAEAISRLQQAQTAVQASAQVFSTLRDSSLLNLLRS